MNLSICIATRNRQFYCKEVIVLLLENRDQNFEICVSDNSDTPSLQGFIEELNDSRVNYSYDGKTKSSSQNMSDSIHMSSGGYICMIGDDDLVLPAIFDLCRFMEEKSIDAGVGQFIPEYIWEDERNNRSKELKIVKPRLSRRIVLGSRKNEILSLFQGGIVGYQEYQLPRVYHGVVKRSVLEKIYNGQTYFHGLSPDIFSTVGLSFFCKNLVVWEAPITVGGACPLSTTGQAYRGEHSGSFSDIPHLIGREDYNWSSEIPKVYAVSTIWSDSALQACRAFGKHNYIRSFSIDRHLCDLISAEAGSIRESIINTQYTASSIPGKMQVRIWWLKRLVVRMVNKILFKKTIKYQNVSDIRDAYYYLK